MPNFTSVTYGVRKVGDLLTKLGRSLIVTEKDDSKIEFDDVPVGALRVDPDDGDLRVKLANRPGWWSPKWAKDYFDNDFELDANQNYEVIAPTIASYEVFVRNKQGTAFEDKYVDPDGVIEHTYDEGTIKIHNHYNNSLDIRVRCYRYDTLKNFENKAQSLFDNLKQYFNEQLELWKFRLTPDCIIEAYLAQNSVTNNKIKDRTINHIKLQQNTITQDEMGTDSVNENNIVSDVHLRGMNSFANGGKIATEEFVTTEANKKVSLAGGIMSGSLQAPEFIGNLSGIANASNHSNNSSLLDSLTVQDIINRAKQSIPQVAVISGTINHGETLPLPGGYRQDQCKWIVSVASDNPSQTRWDIEENGWHMHYRYECYVDDKRIVHVVIYYSQTDPRAAITTTGKANYLVIGIK